MSLGALLPASEWAIECPGLINAAHNNGGLLLQWVHHRVSGTNQENAPASLGQLSTRLPHQKPQRTRRMYPAQSVQLRTAGLRYQRGKGTNHGRLPSRIKVELIMGSPCRLPAQFDAGSGRYLGHRTCLMTYPAAAKESTVVSFTTLSSSLADGESSSDSPEHRSPVSAT